MKRARVLAKQDARDEGSSRVENVDTQKVVARYRREGNRIVSNPSRARKTARRKNSGTSSKLLKNFTGVVKRMSDGTVQIHGYRGAIIGTGRKPNPSKKRATKKRRVARGKR